VEVRGRVLVRRLVAASDVAALRATPQVHPRPAGAQAFHAAGRDWSGVVMDVIEVIARVGHGPRTRE
jgi:hypothetical protein